MSHRSDRPVIEIRPSTPSGRPSRALAAVLRKSVLRGDPQAGTLLMAEPPALDLAAGSGTAALTLDDRTAQRSHRHLPGQLEPAREPLDLPPMAHAPARPRRPCPGRDPGTGPETRHVHVVGGLRSSSRRCDRLASGSPRNSSPAPPNSPTPTPMTQSDSAGRHPQRQAFFLGRPTRLTTLSRTLRQKRTIWRQRFWPGNIPPYA